MTTLLPFRKPQNVYAVLAALALLAAAPAAQAQSVGIGTTSPNTKAALDISATDRGLLIPRLTQAQRLGLSSPPQGLMVYQTDGTASGGTQTGFWYYAGTPAAWVYLNPATPTVAAGPGLSASTSGSTTTVSLGGTALTADTDVPLGANDLTFSGTGNVGIGGTTANLPLTVQGNGTNDAVQLRNNAGTNRWHIGLTTNGTSNALNISESGVADFRLFLKPGGNVGIGTNDPTTRFDVNGSMRVRDLTGTGSRMVVAGADGALSTQAIPSGGGSPTGAAGGALIGTYPNPGLADGAVTTTKLADNSIGNAKMSDNAIGNAELADDAVGIAELSATGTASSTTFLRGDNTWATIPSGSSGWSLTGNATDGTQFLGTTNDQDLYFKRNGNEAFRVYGNGRVSLGNNTNGSSSVMLGFNAGASQTSAFYNVLVGARAGEQINSNNSTFLGYGAGQQTTGASNTLVGFYAGNRLTSGTNNVFIGNQAAYSGSLSITGTNNIVIGGSSGGNLTTNSNNILLGGNSQASSGLYDAYAIGNSANVAQSNSLVIGNERGANDAVSVGIGTSAPSSSLQVNGTFAVGVVNNWGGGGSGSPNGLDQGAINQTSFIGGFYELTPTGASNQYYRLPTASGCPGRIYHLRFNGSTAPIITSGSSNIYDADSTTGTSSYTMTTTNRLITVISDGTDWYVSAP